MEGIDLHHDRLTVSRTGMKCLPSKKLPLARGNVLHDWHAEVLAIRAFNRFLLDELLLTLSPPYLGSAILRPRSDEERTPAEPQPFALREDVQIHMYCSEAPCGDASMELTMSLQADATPWTTPTSTVTGSATSTGDEPTQSALRGRSHFSHLGLVRCKPSRPDAPPTFSKSCTDKLALAQAISLLSGVTSLLVSPNNAYLKTITLPASQIVPAACERAFSCQGRMKPASQTGNINKAWEGGYRWSPFTILSTTREFTWSRRMVPPETKATSSNLSAVWTPRWQETLIGGALQGRKQFDPKGASAICRRNMWNTAVQIVTTAGLPALIEALSRGSYKEVKDGEMLETRRRIKREMKREALQGWVKNSGDDEFGLQTTNE